MPKLARALGTHLVYGFQDEAPNAKFRRTPKRELVISAKPRSSGLGFFSGSARPSPAARRRYVLNARRAAASNRKSPLR